MEKQKVTLYIPHPLAKKDSMNAAVLLVLRVSNNVFAELEITIQPDPRGETSEMPPATPEDQPL